MIKLESVAQALEGLYNHYEEPAKGTNEHLDWESINYINKRVIKLFVKKQAPELTKYMNNIIYIIKVAKSANIKLEFEAIYYSADPINVYADGELLTKEQIAKIAKNAKTEM